MLAIHISHDTLKYAQLVNFKGTPFIESLGKVPLKGGLLVQDTSNTDVIRMLGEALKVIRNDADFPDNSAHIVMESDWFPFMVHHVDGVLQGADLDKYLAWRVTEMLESAASQYSTTHQALRRDSEDGVEYLSISTPGIFNSWIEKISAPSELKIQNVILEIQALGDLLSASGQLDQEGGLQVVLDNQDGRIVCHVYQNKEFLAVFQGTINWDYKISIDYCRGDAKLVGQVSNAIERAIKGKQNPDNVLTNLFYITSSGDASLLNNLPNYTPTCTALNLVEHFNFRNPEFENIDEYAVVLGALSTEIQERFRED